MDSRSRRAAARLIEGHPSDCGRDRKLTMAEEEYERLSMIFHLGRILYARAFAALPRDATVDDLMIPIKMLAKLARQGNALARLRKKIRAESPGPT